MKLLWNLSSLPQDELVDFYVRDVLASLVRGTILSPQGSRNGRGLIKEMARRKPLSSELRTGRDGEHTRVPVALLWQRASG